MKQRSLYPIILAIFAIGSVLSQNAEELPVQIESDNRFPPEHSELDGHIEESDATTAEPTQTTSEYTISDASTLTEETSDSVVEITYLATDASDGTVATLINEAAEPTQTTSESTITDAAAQTSTTEQLENENRDTTSAKLTASTSGSTIGDTASTLNEQLTNVDETTAEEVTKTTSESSILDAAVPILIAEDEQTTTTEGSEITTTEVAEVTSESTVADVAAPVLENNDEQITANDAEKTTVTEPTQTTVAEPTQTTSGSTSADVIVPTLISDAESVTNDESSSTAAQETFETASDSTTADLVTTTLAKDEQTTNEGIETTILEASEPTVGSTVADEVAPTLTTTDDVSDTAVSEPTHSAGSCPKPCICITEGDSNKYIVDCSSTGITELPTDIDPKTTTLKLNNNKLTVIPKVISELKNLNVLNANDNLITELESGSVSELSELVSLHLANNRFLEYPKDLENSLNKLEELDLAGNELKMTPEIFSNYKALRTVTLPEDSPELVSELCSSLKDTLTTVCTKSCEESSFKCSDASIHTQHLLDVALPGTIPFIPGIDQEEGQKSDDTPTRVDSSEKSSNGEAGSEIPTSPSTKENHITIPIPDISSRQSDTKDTSQSKDNIPVNEFSLRTAVNNAPRENVAVQNIVIDTPKESTDNDTDVKVGAKTTETTGGGGVDKSVIAVIVAGMVIIIAVITVKKNWSSIRKRFSSEPRPNDRSDRNANGTTPEEVPLQDKSPV